MSSFRNLFAILVLGCAPLSAWGEVVKRADAPAPKTESCDAPVPSCPGEAKKEVGPWQGTVSLGLSVSTGKDDVITGSFDFSTTYEEKPHQLTLGVTAFYSVKNSESDVNRQTANSEYRYYFWKSWYGFGSAGVERNLQQNLRFRTTEVIGLGYQFLDRKRPQALVIKEDRASLEFGVGYQYQRFSSEGEAIVTNDAVLELSGGYDLVLLHDIRWSTTAKFVLAPRAVDEWRAVGSTDLNIPLVGMLGLQTKLTLDYLNGPLLPGRGGRRLTFFGSLGVSYSF